MHMVKYFKDDVFIAYEERSFYVLLFQPVYKLLRIKKHFQADLDEAYTELKASEERSKNATLEAARIAEQLRQAQENNQQAERERKGLEANIKELQAKIDETEGAKLRGGQKEIARLEHRMKMLTTELEGEQRRYQETTKTIKRQERKTRELEFHVDENKKRFSQMQEIVEKLQLKVKTLKKQVDDAVCYFISLLHLYLIVLM